ncbi:sensor histidine kinase [uncultured Jatrophihabitans sp.]|uniref:sensor histidine kinase n=1 Tax=uncultured Jatrophihabitans sp. TaxID=1610747 RepID=UPI0035CB2DA4
MRFFRPTLRVRMALLYGGLVLLVGVSLLFTCVILLDRAIGRLPLYNSHNTVTVTMPNGVQQVVNPQQQATQARSNATNYLLSTGLLYFGIIVIIGTTGGYLLAKQALRPIAKLTQTARALSTETLDQRINLGGPDDELRELADTFDAMLARLDAAFDSQRLFVANASHELRTPLSVIRTELEVTLSDPDADPDELRRMGDVVASATERAQRLVTSLLTLARLQAVGGGELEVTEPVDLAWLVPGAVHAVTAEAEEKGVRIETENESAATLGDPRLLERLIGNLVENAIRHNVPGGWLRVTTGHTDDKVWVHVANGGTVINGDVNALFEPFRRGGRLRTATRGAGLGLAIVRLIVDAHKGKLQAAAPPFGGLTVRVELPRDHVAEAALAGEEHAQAIA